MRAVLFLVALAGCALDSHGKHRCQRDSDCEGARQCSYQECVRPCPECFLASAQPEAAHAGETITLEGTFGEHSLAVFPGGLEVPVVTVGRHRGFVVVPQGATGGDLTLVSGAKTMSTPFRPLGFEVQFFPGGMVYPQTGGARETPQLSRGRSDAAAFVAGGAVYVLGGFDALGPTGRVERARLNADGTLGSFSVVAEMTPRAQMGSVRLGRYVHVLGGGSDSVERLDIDTLEVAAGPSLKVGRSRVAVAVIGDGLYVIGGQAADGTSAAIERAAIFPDGTLGDFQLQSPLPSARAGGMALVTERQLVVLGGDDGQVSLGSVETAAIDEQGRLQPFSSDASRAAITDGDLMAARLGDRWFFSGGSAVAEASLMPARTLAPLSELPLMTLLGRSSQLVVTGNWLQRLGGVGPVSDGEWLPFVSERSLGEFETQAELVEPRSDPAAVVIGNWLYLIGGKTGVKDFTPALDTVERAPIGSDGSLGAWQTVKGITLKRRRAAFATAVFGGQLCLLGGEEENKIPEIECAPIQDDGGLGAFEIVGSLPPPGRSHFAAAVVGSYLYLMGGNGGSTYLDIIDRAPLGPGPSIGPFTRLPVVLSHPRVLPALAVLDGYLYVTGGRDAIGGTSVDRFPIFPSGDLGPVEALQHLTSGVGPYSRSMPAVVGRAIYYLGGETKDVEDPDDQRYTFHDGVVRATFHPEPEVMRLKWNKLKTVRSGGVAVALGNYVYVIGGDTGRPSSIKDVAEVLRSVERAEIR